MWSGREDLNLRPPAPEAGTLPDCATPRIGRQILAWVYRVKPRVIPAGEPGLQRCGPLRRIRRIRSPRRGRLHP